MLYTSQGCKYHVHILVALLGAQSSCIIKRPRAYFLREPAGGRTQMLPGLSETECGSLRIRANPCAREGGGNGWQKASPSRRLDGRSCCSGWLRLRQAAGGLVQFSAAPAAQHGPSLGAPGGLGPGASGLRAAAGNQGATADLTTCGVLACSAALKPLQDLVGQSRNAERGLSPPDSAANGVPQCPSGFPCAAPTAPALRCPFVCLAQILCRSSHAGPLWLCLRSFAALLLPLLPLPFLFHFPSPSFLLGRFSLFHPHLDHHHRPLPTSNPPLVGWLTRHDHISVSLACPFGSSVLAIFRHHTSAHLGLTINKYNALPSLIHQFYRAATFRRALLLANSFYTSGHHTLLLDPLFSPALSTPTLDLCTLDTNR